MSARGGGTQSTLPLVWVLVGRTQHAAYLVEDGESQCLVQWTSTSTMEYVATQKIDHNLSPRLAKKLKKSSEGSPSPQKTSAAAPASASNRKKTTPSPQNEETTETMPGFLLRKYPNAAATSPQSTTLLPAQEEETGTKLDPKQKGSDELTKENMDSSPSLVDFSVSTDIVDEPYASEKSSRSEFALVDFSSSKEMLDESDASEKSVKPDMPPRALSGSSEVAGELEGSTHSDINLLEDDAPVTDQSFPLVQSAFLQNLAEICRIVTTDGRWRTGGTSSEKLLRWEDGADLSAVTYLSRYYIQPEKRVRRTPCACLLCRYDETENPTQEEKQSQSVANIPSDEEVGGLYLYCRLFYRRGPWFRLDDTYDRYYRPDKRRVPETPRQPEDSSTSHEPASSKGYKSDTNMSREDRPDSVTIDMDLLETQIDCFRRLVIDLSNLSNNGLIRAFKDEEECGKTVGVSVLSTDMRDAVLQKLGTKSKKPSSGSRWRTKGENVIWNQMKQQTSIVAWFKGDASKALPVRKHVDDTVIDSLVLSILKSSCRLDRSEYLPASLRKEHAHKVKERVVNIFHENNLVHYSCFCLRKEPYMSLLRCCRILLCATSGPGEMRSDGTNGWNSISETVGKPPLANRIRPPGIHTWCTVSYPGSLSRFGITAATFSDSYEYVDPHQHGASALQIFRNRCHFFAWESVVEIRANTDYLLQLSELVRYETRRAERDEVLLSKTTFHGDSVDYMGLLSEDGRNKLVRPFVLGNKEFSGVAEMISDFLKNLEEMELYEWDRLLVIIAALCISVLSHRQSTVQDSDLAFMESYPWLRHLWWEGCLAYLLWDLIPILERLDLYDVAISALRLLLYGAVDRVEGEPTPLAALLLSRRARGKAYDRLVIDMKHSKKKQSQKNPDADKTTVDESPTEPMSAFYESILTKSLVYACIPFSAIRSLARRLKKPLTETLGDRKSLEAIALGLRCKTDVPGRVPEGRKGYSDWTPITDYALANNVHGADASVGSRCVFIGYGDGSLNVEQLAMEAYNKGHLPLGSSEKDAIAGWEGWHDEGGHIRALFRIVCGGTILGMDFGCAMATHTTHQHRLLNISPYQSVPFDLHVGFEIAKVLDNRQIVYRNSFYSRRRNRIEDFLCGIEKLAPQEICNLVYDSIKARLVFSVETGRKDPSLDSDLRNLRTLSLVAAGCGGEQLASIFRCLMFDYRHWSGGLPDLLLVRASTKGDDGSSPQLVKLSEWIGESFSDEFQLGLQNEQGASMLADDEFLGCGKIGDSGGTQIRSSGRRSTTQNRSGLAKSYTMDDLQSPLQLSFNGEPVIPETMMVEVKSSNDRLDPRQEDWLNVLDRYGNARVCKFEDSKKAKRRAAKEEEALPKANEC